MPFVLHAVDDAASVQAARALIGEYLRWVAGVAAERHGLVFDAEAMLASDLTDRSKFFAPHGRLYVLRSGADDDIGVGALKRVEATATTAEIQRMYVRPGWRGRGAARMLLSRLLDDARAMGCEWVRLESLKSLDAAHALYRSAGFVEAPPWDDNGMRDFQSPAALGAYRPNAVFMERRLV